MEVTKVELEEYKHLRNEARTIYRIWRKLEQEKLSFGSNTDDMPKSSNKRTLADVVAESDARSQQYYYLHLQALKRLNLIELFVKRLDSALHRDIIRLKYIECKTWCEVGNELNREKHAVRKIRDEVLETYPPLPT